MLDNTPRPERVYYDPPPTPQPVDSWWSRYKAELKGLTSTARAALESDCRYILDRGILGVGSPSPQSWPASRVRTGLVMGSVQSGKTASMLGVTALAIDHQVDIVVVLAGTRLALWRQTYERLTAQLDAGEDSAKKVGRRMLCPAPGIALSDESRDLLTTYRMAPASVRQKLKLRRPIIVVAMKQTNHLHALGESLRSSVFDAIEGLGRPVHMLVLDDEADDGSILDAVVETAQDPVYGNLKQIPRAIANIWEPAIPAPNNLFTTYVGYTATPQANLLQEDHNPLAPRDFLVSLRTPLDVGYLIDTQDPGNLSAPRSSTYPEPAGSHAYYTGGEVFYRRGGGAGLCMPTTAANHDIAEAVRAFLVAGAIRLHRSGQMGPASAATAMFGSRDEAAAMTSAPHSMLFHPSANIVDHFRGAEDVLIWAGVQDRKTARLLLKTGEARLPAALVTTLDTDPANWAVWLDRYRASAREIELEFNLLNPSIFPNWLQIKHLLASEIIPGTRVAVVNSDPAADDRPAYTPSLDESTGQWRPGHDLSTIFVSGNVMARGLTLEGMTTALFQRSSTNPLADTQMQMQRWFGYRGSYIELCRVFASPDQLSLFRAYHDIDEAIRSAITERMAGGAPEPAVLHGMNFSATGKIANIGHRPLSPGAQPFVRVVNSGLQPDPNAKLLADLFTSAPSTPLVGGRTVRGRILNVPLSLTEAAGLLDRLEFDSYRPSAESQLGTHWKQIEARVAAVEALSDPVLYRPPLSGSPGDPSRLPCPYAIAAYLRLWAACLTRPVRGLFITGQPGSLWSMADLQQKVLQQPKFWVGIRYGAGSPISTGPLSRLSFDVPATTKNVNAGELTTTWGANDPTAGPGDYRGDVFFDYYHRNERLPATTTDSAWRPAGSDGQILFYINQHPGQKHPAVAMGACIPAGGPEQFAATRAGALMT